MSENLTIDPAISSAMSELGIDQNSLDADEITNVESDNKEVEAKAEESSEEEASGEDGDHTEAVEASESQPEGEEKVEAPVEEPKLTAKEFQEIETQRQQLEIERKSFHEEKTKLEAEFQEKYADKIKAHDELDSFISELEVKDPDLYGLIKQSFNEHVRQYNNPQVAALREKMSAIESELNQFKSNATAEVTLAKLDGDMKKLQDTLGKDAEAAGVKLDLQKIKEKWAKNPDLSLEETAFVLYGPALMKASASKAKVEAVTKKVQSQPSVKTAGSVSATKATSTQDWTKMSAEDRVNYFARQLKGA